MTVFYFLSSIPSAKPQSVFYSVAQTIEKHDCRLMRN